MIKYIGKKCPYCNSLFTESDSIVICSSCEMPHHKECWVDNNGCTTFGCSGTIQGIDTGADYGVSNAPKYDVNGGNAGLICSCGAPLNYNESFCGKCGTPVTVSMTYAQANNLRQSNVVPTYQQPVQPTYQQPVQPTYQQPVQQMYQQPVQQVFIDEEMPQYIDDNQNYYMKAFYNIKQTQSKVSWNTFAFLITPFWFMYRKMYVIGGAIVGLSLICSLINGIFSFLVTIALAVTSGLLANYIYMIWLERIIRNGKYMTGPQKSYYVDSKGGINAIVPSIVAVVYTLLTVIILI